MISKALHTYRTKGALGLTRAVASKLGLISPPPGVSYQEKVAASLHQRLDQLRAAFPGEARSVLDVGCNLGDVSAGLAQDGYWTVGLERSSQLVQEARRRHAGLERCAFMCQHLTPTEISSLPQFDAILLLSVQHHWLMEWGPDVAGEMLRTITKKAKYVLIFEGASRRIRYGSHPPDFEDNDEATVTAYLEGYLAKHTSDVTTKISPLGKIPCVGEREPYRWNYALYR